MPIAPREFENLVALQSAVEELLRATFAAESPSDFAVMLSGGSTPLPIYAAIAAEPSPVNPHLHLTFSDDRHVPQDSPDSNYGNTAAMIAALGVPERRILAVDTSLSLMESAAKFELDFDTFFRDGGTLRLALLGMGTDTHTCSLFSEDDLAACEGRLAIPVLKEAPPHRVSVTPSVLERAELVVFLVAGANKAAVIRQLIDAPETTIAGQATAACKRVEIWYALN